MAGEAQENETAADAQARELRQTPEADGERKPGFHDFLYTGELLETRSFRRHRSDFGGEAALELALAHANLAITMERHRNEPGAIESAKDRLIEAVRALDPDNLPF